MGTESFSTLCLIREREGKMWEKLRDVLQRCVLVYVCVQHQIANLAKQLFKDNFLHSFSPCVGDEAQLIIFLLSVLHTL